MNKLEYYRPSSFLIVLALIILGLGVLMALYVNNTARSLRFDAKIINETGIVRGAIQRVTKLVLSNSYQRSDEIFIEINCLFDHFISEDDSNLHDGVDETVFNGILNLRGEWHTLESLLIEFEVNPSEQTERDIVEESEHCWEAADSVVLSAQFATEDKVGEFKLFYRILAINAITAILVILHVIIFVRRKLEFESLHDPLTDLFNRRSFDNAIQSEVARCLRYSSTLSLILLDADNFKIVNDEHGHGAGDKVLIDLAGVIRNSVRESDLVFRVGGDEFAIICPETTADDAFRLAEKVREIIEQYPFATGGTETISLGVAGYQAGDTKEQLYQHADQALYRAKNSGRNRAEVYSE
ncbi:MAG: GGDEF domain-containing protein [Candidatus Sabulitectum sp.]|nr:GGDEF domain-containing protein [Candidatus Sabulitectum sp.]